MGAGAGRKEKELLKRLSGALSDEEIRRVLACGLLELQEKGALDGLAARLGGDTATTLRAVLAVPTGGSRSRDRAPAPSAGKARVLQEWERAWEEWRACVEETGDEEGRYVLREHSWEEPCPDTTALEEDLDRIAGRLLPLIPRVLDGDLDPDFDFAGAIRDTGRNLGAGLPEWISAPDGWSLGPVATRALIEWEWRLGKRAGRDAFAFADRICLLDDSLSAMSIAGESIAAFLLGLPPADGRLVLDGIRGRAGSGHWKRALESPWKTWAAIHRELARRHSPDLFLRTCAADVGKDWRLGLPVLRDHLAKGRAGPALEIARKAAAAMTSYRSTPWDPGETLLDGFGWTSGGTSSKQELELLEGWRSAAMASGDGETASALRLQIAARTGPMKPDRFLEELRAVHGEFPRVADRLYADWRKQVVDDSHSGSGFGTVGRGSRGPGWVHALVDAAREGPGAGETLLRALREWLAAAEAEPGAPPPMRSLLELLTLDLDHEGRVARRSRALDRILRRDAGRIGDPALRGWRRTRLREFGARTLIEEVLEVWARVAVRCVPDPAATSSEYADCADWLAVAAELDGEGSRLLLERWTSDHRRRRNLWKVLRRRGLAPGEGA